MPGKQYNLYSELQEDEHGKYYIGYAHNTNLPFYIDEEDFDTIKNLCWYTTYRKKDNMTVLMARQGAKKIRMHQIIGCKYYDHIDRNHLNNRRYNLRKATSLENSWNRGATKRNKTGIIGVSFIQKTKKYYACIKANGKNMNLGVYDNIENAIVARLKAEQKYFGEFAPQRELFSKYGI